MNIGFYTHCISVRGTSRAIYNYAKYNEKILKNKSYIFYDKISIFEDRDEEEKESISANNHMIELFKNSFVVIPLCNFEDIDSYISMYDIKILFLEVEGSNDYKLSKIAKNIVHCVFNCNDPRGDLYCSVSKYVPNNNGKYPYLNNIVEVDPTNEDLRKELNIPEDAIVIGRIGGYYQFDIEFVHRAIIKYLSTIQNNNIYFLFVCTAPFYNHGNIINIDLIIDDYKKKRFINTCNFMLHARMQGETFGMSIGEFAICNKQIISCKVGDNAHVEFLKDKCIWFSNENEIYNILLNINNSKIEDLKKINYTSKYNNMTPEKIMNKFNDFTISTLKKNKIIDCFTFYNEIDMLKKRLKYLYRIVDYFIIVEATKTHQNNNKELFFENNKNLFKKYLNKIIHIVVDNMPEGEDSWLRENFQRTCINKGIECLKLNDNDLILISDLDEIPDKNIFKNKIINGIYNLEQDIYFYNINCKGGNKWYNSKCLTYDVYKNTFNSDPQKIRMYMSDKTILKGGWHFSYFGDVNFIINKIKNFSHKEYNNDFYTNEDYIKDKIKNCDDLYSRDNKNTHDFKYTKLEENDNPPPSIFY